MTTTETGEPLKSPKITFRLAEEKDAKACAELLDLSNEGTSAISWAKMAKEGETWIDVGMREVLNPKVSFGIKNTLIAEVNGEVAGTIVTTRIRDSFPPFDYSKIPDHEHWYFDLIDAAAGSFYLRNMAIYPKFRGLKIANFLIDGSISQGFKLGAPSVTAIIWEKNDTMKHMYGKRGFELFKKTTVKPGGTYPEGDEMWLLGKKNPDIQEATSETVENTTESK
jgi:ribosomal protein S18 acetylase RimI-like enzyme